MISIPESVSRFAVVSSFTADATATGPRLLLDRLQRDPAPGGDVRTDSCVGGVEVARLVGVDDRSVLGRQVGATLELAARITCIIRLTESSR